MDEYIKKQAALDVILSEPPEVHYPSWYAEKIKMLSTADVAPVVRCKDCKYAVEVSSSSVRFCMFSHMPIRPDDFCSFGERKDTE